MEAINDSLKYVTKSAELVKRYLNLKVNDIENQDLLGLALNLLEKTVDALSKEAIK